MRVLVLSLFTVLSLAASAQDTATDLPDWAAPTPYEPGPSVASASSPPLPPSDPPQVPLDGGLSLLALAGAGYAVKKLRDRA